MAGFYEVKDIKEGIFNHFQEQFRKRKMRRPSMENFMFKQLHDQESELLIKSFTEEEIKQVVCECESSKSPSPNGVSFDFIKEFWEELKEDFVKFFKEFYENGRLVKGINSTFIGLIPKKDSSSRTSDFRPICLIGSLYKILSKVLANRLKKFLHNLIGDVQSAFIQGCQILDGVLIANEVINEAKRMNKEAPLFKVNFEKAYDSVDCDFLEFMMRKLNFPVKWRSWINECVSTSTISVLINDSPSKEFEMETGLRQGEPLSPFLFLVVAEGLNVLMKKVVIDGEVQGYKVGRDEDLVISHLQFANDTLIVGKKCWSNIFGIKAIFQLFELISGLKVNFDKSKVSKECECSRNCMSCPNSFYHVIIFSLIFHYE